jgi:hypothetical protein
MPNGLLVPGVRYEVRIVFTTSIEMANPWSVLNGIQMGYVNVEDMDLREVKEGHGQ